MAENEDSLIRLQNLHRDLQTVAESTLPELQRLFNELDLRLGELKALLDKTRKNDASRKALDEGKLQIQLEDEDVVFQFNDDFKQQAIQLAEVLDLDEKECAALLFSVTNGGEYQRLDRSPLMAALIRFHRRRELLLACLRLVMKIPGDDVDPIAHEGFERALESILDISQHSHANAAAYWSKCLSSMGDIERWLQQLSERVQSLQVLEQAPSPEVVEIIEYQQRSLTRQHETLSAICSYMVKRGYASADNLKALLSKAKSIDKHDLITIHYVPIITSLVDYVGSSEANCSRKEARSLHDMIVASRDNDSWALRNFQAATLVWWLAVYSGRYIEDPQDPELNNVDLKQEAAARSAAFVQALKDGAFHFMLSVCQDTRPDSWYDPAKTGLVSLLLHDATVLPPDSARPDEFFQMLVMEQLQQFVDAYVTNMPDTLRKLKVEEDDQRKLLHSRLQRSPVEYELHLERFLLIIAYAFQGFPEAAHDFWWADKDGNLYGFLQWAAKRQPTPRIAAFSEMLRSIATGKECSEAAHNFLLEEGASASGKGRRASSLSYSLILLELIEFANDIKEPKKTTQGSPYPTPPEEQIKEPEWHIMLESYLRLLAHLARQNNTARQWLLENQNGPVRIFLDLAGEGVPERLRAAAFDALAALLTNKQADVAHVIWEELDKWTWSSFAVGPKPSNVSAAASRQATFEAVAAGFNASNAFIELLQTLIEPYSEDLGLHDTLPFPENLGHSERMPGIEEYVDFVAGKILGTKCAELQDSLQIHVMRWNCLRFITSCLSSFNEDLVIFANKSNLDVDSAIDSSSLAAYVRLHPFARTMEWLFNDNVLRALFAASHFDVAEVDSAPSDSPLVQSLMLTIEVMDLVLKLQATYLDIVRPLIKMQSSFQRSTVANPAFASFEDAILSNLQIVVDLGLYCGTAHETLTIGSLRLLEKLSSSRKLMGSSSIAVGQRASRNKIIGMLEKDNEFQRISLSLVGLMQWDERELEGGIETPGHIIKMEILNFLNSTLGATSTTPTIAHLLLGFSCRNNTVEISDNGLWATNHSLFHSILTLAVQYPDRDAITFISWRSTLKQRCWDILRKLWRSPLTSALILSELRLNELLFVHAANLVTIDANTQWHGMSLNDEEQAKPEHKDFFYTERAVALQNFLQQRSAFYDYAARELRTAAKQGLATLKSRIQSSLLGATVFPGGDQYQNPTVFDLFDFMELELYESELVPSHPLTGGFDFDLCKEDKDGVLLFDMRQVEQIFTLQTKALRKNGELVTLEQEEKLQVEAHSLLLWFIMSNQRALLVHSQKEDLKSWVQLVTVMLQSCDFDEGTKTAFILQTVQVILPKLEKSFSGDQFVAMELAALAEALIQKIDFNSTSFEKSRAGDFANDRLLQLFRTSLVGVNGAVATQELREYFYQICFRYLRGTSKNDLRDSALALHTLKTIKNCGDNLLEVISDDAYAGEKTCKVSALLLLDSFVSLAIRQKSRYILDIFVKLNFISVLVDNIKNIPAELKAAPAAQVPDLLSYYDASLALLLRICQTPYGAQHVLNAGLFQSIRDSLIFSTDPDIGLEFENPEALKKYFGLMLAVLRVINAAILSRGTKNDQAIFQAREFLRENRHSMVAIFKRSVSVGSAQDVGVDLGDLVDCFTLLVQRTGFLEYEEKSNLTRSSSDQFSFS